MNRLWVIAVLIGSFAFAQAKKESVTIHFDSNSADISADEAQQFWLFFSNQNVAITTLQINGFCDDIGTADSNLILSEKRAYAVADYLKTNFKLSASAIVGKGEKELTSTTPEEIEKERAEHRCVIIAIGYTDKIISQKPANDGYKTFAEELAVGDKIIIENLIFEAGKTAFADQEKATAELQKIIGYFQKNPTIQFEISGHVCCITQSFKDAHDKTTGLNNLSQTRAKRIYDYLVDHGIAKDRMSHKGYGRQFPRPDMPEKDNKRVEIVITRL